MPMQTSRKHVKILPALITNIFGDLRARQSYKHIFVSLVQGISAQGICIFPTLPIFPKNVYAANGDFYKIIFVKLLASRREVWIVPITWGTHKPKQNAPKTPQQNTTQPCNAWLSCHTPWQIVCAGVVVVWWYVEAVVVVCHTTSACIPSHYHTMHRPSTTLPTHHHTSTTTSPQNHTTAMCSSI